MAATALLKQSPYLKEWMAKAYPPEEASTVKKNEQLVATPLEKWTLIAEASGCISSVRTEMAVVSNLNLFNHCTIWSCFKEIIKWRNYQLGSGLPQKIRFHIGGYQKWTI